MKLRTILLFGAIGVILFSPTLLRKIRSGMGLETTPVGNPPFSDPATDLAGVPVSPANGVPGRQSPFQFAGTRSVAPVATTGNNVATAPPMTFQPAVTHSEPVYYAFTSLPEFLRFDVSPAWIKTRWSRVAMVPGEDDLTGMRVSLVSGPRPQDIHGSLTYYFDNRQRVQRIGFKGWTGDARELVQLVQRMGLSRQKANGAGTFTLRHWGKMKGVLRLDHPSVVQRERETEQLMVLLELIGPDSSLAVSRQTQAIVKAMQ